MSENVIARFIEPNKLGNYNLMPQYIGAQNVTLAFVGEPPRVFGFGYPSPSPYVIHRYSVTQN
ncbi:MAG: hypothetical protein KAX39_07875 [candidate division Zixibacteria bacterium]|nr:hypothetical protein [candidate division Zixibacteria bacterium]